MTTMAATLIKQSSSPSSSPLHSDENDCSHDDEAFVLWGDLSPSSSLSEPYSQRALSVCLCALAAEGQESPQELGPGLPEHWSPLLSCDDLNNDSIIKNNHRDLWSAYASDEVVYDFDSSIALSGSSSSIGTELANVLRDSSSAVNSSDSSDFEERLAKEQVISEYQDHDRGIGAEDQRPGRRVVFVHDVQVYL
jgi:hypothetical protein